MKSNLRMQQLLGQLSINPDLMLHEETSKAPKLQMIDGCVFLEEQYELSKVTSLEQIQDRTAYECFLNHVHFQVGQGKQALELVFDYASAIRRSLVSLGSGSFEIILSVADGGCTVRFHKCRPGEVWLSENLDSYEHEAILAMRVGLP